MTPVCSTHPVVSELIRALGLPDNCVGISLAVEVGRAVVATAQYYPTESQMADALTVIKKYKLAAQEDEDEQCHF